MGTEFEKQIEKGFGVGGEFDETVELLGSDARQLQGSLDGDPHKKAVSRDGVDEGILRRVASTSEDAQLQNRGLAGDKLLESVPGFIQASGEKVLKNEHSAYIVLGRDRNADLRSGYGGKGHTQAAAIDVVVGRKGYSARQTNEKNESLYVDPDFVKDASRVYISQKSNIDDYLNLADGSVGNSKAKSCVALKADGIRIVAREGIKLITRTDEKNSQGGSVRSVLGIDLIAGNNDDELQPIPKGDNLSEAIQKLTDHVDKLNGIVDTFLMSQMELNEKLTHHFHNSPFFAAPTAPSFPVVGAGIKALIDQLTKTKRSLLSHKANLALYKQTYLKQSGQKYINSRHNNTN
tara:strand:- start:23311 stop:24357 length:1047 start_codon:yes stop_codon:yes gene_type:complete